MDVIRQLEAAFWVCFIAWSLWNQSIYWKVVLSAFSAARLLILALIAWSSFPFPWQSFGDASTASLSFLGWTILFLICLYCLCLTPLHVLFSPAELLTKHSPKHEPMNFIDIVYEPEGKAQVEYV
jgi:hypothetical protein